MPKTDQDQQAIQRGYYATTASQYNHAHVNGDDSHSVALGYMSGLLTSIDARSVLDVGSGTGRAASFLRQRHQDMLVVGVEPVIELLDRRDRQVGATYVCGSGLSLPFPDRSFDAVCATALLHHVPDPASAIAEMTRVARKAVMISDANRFGQGSRMARMTKLAIWRSGCWPLYSWLRTRGRGYLYSVGDGVYYSYSIFDSAPALDAWGNRTFVIPTARGLRGGYHPLLTAPEGLLVAVREERHQVGGNDVLPGPRLPAASISSVR